MKRILLAFGLSSVICGGLSAVSAAQTVDFSDLFHPPTGVGRSIRRIRRTAFRCCALPTRLIHPPTMIIFTRSPEPETKRPPTSFPTTAPRSAISSDKFSAATPAIIRRETETPFNLKTFTVFQIDGQFTLTSSLGATQIIDQPGVYTFGAGFAGITEFRHDYTGDTDGNMILDSLTFKPTTYRTVSGVIALDGELTASLQPVHVELRAPGATAPLLTYDLPAGGAFTLNHVPDSVYAIAFKGANTLRRVIPSVDLTQGNQANLTVLLEPGDANGDNICDSSDFGVLIGSFNSAQSVAGSGYDPTCDFNNDGFVDSSDFSLLIGNFNQAGDE